MKILYLCIFLLCLLSIACSENSNKSSTQESDKTEFLLLAKSSGCLACHNTEKKIVGPAFEAISQRYTDNPSAQEILVEKVKAGGKGNWIAVTGGVPMPPYSPRVSDDNIGKLVRYILNLDGSTTEPTNINVDGDPVTRIIEQGRTTVTNFNDATTLANYRLDITMINGIVDAVVTYLDTNDVLQIVAAQNGIDGIAKLPFSSPEKIVGISITGITDATVSLSLHTLAEDPINIGSPLLSSD